jgi:predicted GTPase
MSKSSTLAIGIGLASGALLAAWLLTGTRKEKTRKFISEKTASIRKTIKTEKPVYDEAESYLS